MTRSSSCPLCGGISSRHKLSKKCDGRGSGEIELRSCLGCQHVFLGEYDRGYEASLYEYYRRTDALLRSAIPSNVEMSIKKLLNRLSKYTTEKRMLDVGAGKGELVEVATRSGWNALGTELSESAIDYCQARKLNVVNRDLEDLYASGERWPVITALEVIEHVPNPVNFLTMMTKLLEPNGVIYLTCPNFNSIDRFLLGPDWDAIHREHISYFTPKQIARLATLASLRVEQSKTVNVSPQLIRYFLRLFFRTSVRPANAAQKPDEVPFGGENNIKVIANFFLNIFGFGATIKLVLRP